jgi:phytoene dehydrogenase-like protein
LSAAITLAREGLSVCVFEANDLPGGGVRSEALTLPGFVHDVCSSIYPLAAGSPFFRELPLQEHGLEWVHPDVPLAHPLDGGRAALMHHSVNTTAEGLRADGGAYRKLMEPLAEHWSELTADILQPMIRVPRHPLLLAQFGMRAIVPARFLAEKLFKDETARALFAGIAAHSTMPLESITSSAFGLVLGAAGHAVGWPLAGGGAQRLTDALVSYLRSLGGEVQTGMRINHLDELPRARAVLLDVTPRQLLQMAGDRLPARYTRRLKNYRYGPGIFKADYALDGPVPWANPEVARAGTIHIGGTLGEIAAAEREVADGKHPERPFVLAAQQSLFDEKRAPEGKHTFWAYCHVPAGSTVDMRPQIERQIERFAPGFRDRVLACSVLNTAAMEHRNANMIGGDIVGGRLDVAQILARPVLSLVPYRTPAKGIYICSSSTPPGGGAHGMCGYNAATVALRDLFS